MSSIEQVLQTIADNLVSRMHDRGVKEPELAKISGVSRRTVGNFVRPNNRKPVSGEKADLPSGTIANLVKLALALDIEPSKLLKPRSEKVRQR